jgi:cell wall-associated NlpC family hydrolase
MASPARATEYEAYVVQGRQSISSIAQEYGITADQLARLNQLNVSDALQPGQILLVPLAAQLTAQSGATPAPSNPETSEQAAPSDPNKITGTVATVTAKRASIRSAPNGGLVLYDKVTKGISLLVIGQTDAHYAVYMSNGSTGYIPCVAVALSDEQMSVDSPVRQTTNGQPELVRTAFEYLNTPYVYGGRLPDSVDCSLFVQTVFRRHGINLPRTAAEQFQVGEPVDVANLLPGDRLYFYDRGSSTIGHTGLYIGDNKFIHASSNRRKVAVDYLSIEPYISRFAGARR